VIFKTEHKIEGLNPEGDWVTVGLHVDPDADPRKQRDDTVKMLRHYGIERYSKVRLAKYVTTIEIVGEDISV
jgi:hypothetical protein